MSGRLPAIAIAGAFLLGTAAGFAYATYQIPRGEMGKVEARLKASTGGPNRMRHGDRRIHETRGVVMPAPDLLYSACSYDLSEGAVEVSVPVSAGYTSVAFYAHNTDNFLTISPDGHEQGEEIRVLLQAGDGGSDGDTPADYRAISPTPTGIVLVRRLIAEDADLEALRADQAADTCSVAGDERDGTG